MVEVHFTFKDKNGGSIVVFVSSLVDSEGLIYGGCLPNFHVRLSFCDTEDMLLYFQWIGDSLEPLYFLFLSFFLCVWLHLV